MCCYVACSNVFEVVHMKMYIHYSVLRRLASYNVCLFLNQARAGHRPVCTWFLKIDPVRIVGMHVCLCMRVCLRPRLLITSGVMWRDIDLIRMIS